MWCLFCLMDVLESFQPPCARIQCKRTGVFSAASPIKKKRRFRRWTRREQSICIKVRCSKVRCIMFVVLMFIRYKSFTRTCLNADCLLRSSSNASFILLNGVFFTFAPSLFFDASGVRGRAVCHRETHGERINHKLGNHTYKTHSPARSQEAEKFFKLHRF